MDLTLPLDNAAIERILLAPLSVPARGSDHRSSKSTSASSGSRTSRTTSGICRTSADGSPALPPTILTEAVAQVGAIMILAKPENRQRLTFFAGIERVRYRRPVHPGDVVEIEATVLRLRSRMGRLKGVARVERPSRSSKAR